MNKLRVGIEAVHSELDVLNTILGINGQVSYKRVQEIVKDIRGSLERLDELAMSIEEGIEYNNQTSAENDEHALNRIS